MAKVNDNTLELRDRLYNIAASIPHSYPFAAITGIINAVIGQYLTKTGYYPENAIESFAGFLRTGILVW